MSTQPGGPSSRARAVLRVRPGHAAQRPRFPFLVGGAYALAPLDRGSSGTPRTWTSSSGRPTATERFEALEAAGYRTETTFPHWLAKAFDTDDETRFRRPDLPLGQRRGRGRRRAGSSTRSTARCSACP